MWVDAVFALEKLCIPHPYKSPSKGRGVATAAPAVNSAIILKATQVRGTCRQLKHVKTALLDRPAPLSALQKVSVLAEVRPSWFYENRSPKVSALKLLAVKCHKKYRAALVCTIFESVALRQNRAGCKAVE